MIFAKFLFLPGERSAIAHKCIVVFLLATIGISEEMDGIQGPWM
jgi:hypothetical protein